MTLSLEDLEMEVIIISKNFLLTHMCADFTCIRISGIHALAETVQNGNVKKEKKYNAFEKKKKIVGHIRFYLPQAKFKFLQDSSSKLSFMVTGWRVNGTANIRLEIHVKCILYVHEKALFQVQRKSTSYLQYEIIIIKMKSCKFCSCPLVRGKL